jgi:two-component system, OmpR family, sensor histidine kinase MtrB
MTDSVITDSVIRDSVSPMIRTPSAFARWRGRLGLRARATIAFALGAMLVSTLISVLTYQLVRSRFIEQRITQSVTRAQANAAQIESSVTSSGLASYAIKQLSLTNPAYTVGINDINTVCPKTLSQSDCSAVTTISEPVQNAEMALRLKVVDGVTAYVVEPINGVPNLIIGVPLYGNSNELAVEYFERVPLNRESEYLSDLSQALALAATLASIFGAIFGRIVSIRIMRPLKQVAKAAQEISSGRLNTRIEIPPDSDLDPLVGSFNGMAESLQRRIERDARFASDVSHELRTPLTSLTAAAQLLASRRDDVAERSHPALDVLASQTEQFRQLVLDLLEISRFDAGAAELNMAEIDLPDFVRQIAVSYGDIPVVSTRMIPATARVDKRRIERILANLLQNAQNYAGGATGITLSSSLDQNNETVADGRDTIRLIRLIVDDAGKGIPPDEREVIFERFRRGSAQRTANTKGTGLGLSLVSEHAGLHGGSVWIEDSPEGGARFVVELTEAPPLAPGVADVTLDSVEPNTIGNGGAF